ncbi:MAG: SAM-dependent methyltransferase [Bacteriovoracaceae bacterium]|nr:SAM-dependent methyltransferase [Bacteriovoracaceae bacterium]
MKAKLTLIPTPIDEVTPLEATAKNILSENWSKALIVVEEAKVARQRWLRWGLPREAIEKFVLYNEHHTAEDINHIIKALKSGQEAYLMSDCGLPAFCDPGYDLINRCHDENIPVTSTPFPNSIVLALALSGFNHQEFFFAGFIPHEDRAQKLKKHFERKETFILMDTPYRLDKLMEEIAQLKTKRRLFLAMDLNTPEEKCVRGKIETLKKTWGKREFILVVE